MAPSADRPAALDTILANLEGTRPHDPAERFTLDREQARRKMRDFQLSDARRYVLELVQAAVHKGAQRIRVDLDADDMRLRFDGAPFTLEDYDQLYTSLFARQDRVGLRATRQLAIGLNSALALNPRFVRVVSGNGDERAVLEMRPDQPDTFRHDAAAPLPDGVTTEIHVRERFRAGLVMRFVRKLRGRIAEETLLRHHCQYAEVEIALERLCKLAEVRHCSPHSLRHSAITAALDATGGDVRRVRAFSRHAKLETLSVYDDNRTDRAAEVARLVAL